MGKICIMKSMIKKNLFLYLLAALAVTAVKVFYGRADSDALAWILAPAVWWAGILGGISFEKIPHVGYVSHTYRFIVAPSCSGVRFLLLAFAMMVFSFTHLMDSRRKKVLWFCFSIDFSYLSTVFVNGIRIAASIYLPLILRDKNLMPGWLTAHRLHTIIGTCIYFSLLFVIYGLAEKFCVRFFIQSDHAASRRQTERFIAPVFWYFVTVLGIPFLGRLYRNRWDGFLPYALLVAGVCIAVELMLLAFRRLWGKNAPGRP